MRVKRHLPVAVTLLMTLLTATTGRAVSDTDQRAAAAATCALRMGLSAVRVR